jgi:hypothetical protein
MRRLEMAFCFCFCFLAISAVQAAKNPDQKNDRQWNADEP